MDICAWADAGTAGLFVAAGIAALKLVLDKLDELLEIQRIKYEREKEIARKIKMLNEQLDKNE